MWALIVDGSINRFFKVPTAFKHPTDWDTISKKLVKSCK